VIGTDVPLGVGYLRPQAEHLFQHPQLLGVRGPGPGVRRRGPRGEQRALVLVRAAPVQGELNRYSPGRGQRRVRLQRLGEPAVRSRALARQQVLPHRLADQLVPERVPVCVADQHVGGDRGPQRSGQRRIIKPGHYGEQPVADPDTARGGRPEHLLGRLRQLLHRAGQQIPQ
jgi:hypothetical protein